MQTEIDISVLYNFADVPFQTDDYVANQKVVSDLILTVSQLITQLGDVFTGDLSVFEQTLPYWAHPAVWTQVINNFANSLSTAPPFDILRYEKLSLLQKTTPFNAFKRLYFIQQSTCNVIINNNFNLKIKF